MSDQEIIDTIDVSLREHMTPGAPSDGSYCCARAVLAALRERYAIVELPKPDDGPDGAGGYAWGTTVAPVSTCHGQVWMEDCDMDPDWAEELAAALLAAADKAEEGQ